MWLFLGWQCKFGRNKNYGHMVVTVPTFRRVPLVESQVSPRRRRWITSLLCGLSACWRQPLVGGLKWRWHTQPSRSREGGIAFCFFFFSLICAILSFSAVVCGRGSCHGCEPLALRRLLCVANVRSALPSRGAILTVGVAVSHLKLAAPLY